MIISRDLAVTILSCLSPSRYLDAMGATGIRGLRAAHEVGIPAVINDRNPRAVDLIRRNAALYPDLPIEVSHQDANAILSVRRFDAVDIDPFGTPAPFIDAAARGTVRYLFVTATDTAPLCGAHQGAGRRRYFAQVRRTPDHAEIGLRVLLGFIAREVAKYDRGIVPLLSIAHSHFVRLHLKISEGARAADRTLGSLGYLLTCQRCPYRTESFGLVPPAATCPACGMALLPTGPLWLDTVHDRGMIGQAINELQRRQLPTSHTLTPILSLCHGELPIAGHYDYHQLAKVWSVSPPTISNLLEWLADAGYRASRAHYSGYAVKTDAPLDVLFALYTRRRS